MTKALLFSGLAAFVIVSCGPSTGEPDAYGQFEAVEITLSAEAGGPVLSVLVEEGDSVSKGQLMAVIDTVPAVLKRQALDAQRAGVKARRAALEAQIDVLREQLRVAARERQRVQKLFDDGAATEKQRDDADGQVGVLEKQLTQAHTQLEGLAAEDQGLSAQAAAIRDQFKRSVVRAPAAGTVLTRFIEPGELAVPGKPLFTLADLSSLYLKAYAGGDQLPQIAVGDLVTVVSDAAGGNLQQRAGRITWIASKAEFTPKIIQTRKERVTLVYALKIRVDDPSGLHIGMPGEVLFKPR